MAIDQTFFLAKPGQFGIRINRPFLMLRAIIFSGFLTLTTINALGQLCNCPPLSTCSPCSGGLTRLTLRFNGTLPSLISAFDDDGMIYSGILSPGSTFSFQGSKVNEKFVGSSVYVTINGALNATIFSSCGSVYPGTVVGSFTVMSAFSKNGGNLCCLPSSMETIPPVISNCPSSFSVNLPSSSCTTPVNWTPPSATDNCTLESFVRTHSPGDNFTLGNTIVVYTATDSYGNSSTCSFNVTVRDITPPVISGCPTNITVPANSLCKAIASWTPPTASDNCTVTMISNHSPGEQFSTGVTPVTYTATDGKGNVSTCTFNVIVEDKIPPVIAGCPSDISVSANGSCQALVTWTLPSVTDNCSAVLSSTHNPGSNFPFGETIVTYTATDPSGNASTCSFKVLVSNASNPNITACPKDITINATNTAPLTVTWEEPQGSVLCGELSVKKSHTPGSSFPVGTTLVSYEFEGEDGNSSICEFNVIVTDQDAMFGVSKVVTPDGDGINDTWLISNIEKYRANTVLVVDRWGNKIFSATGYDNENIFWNATNKNGTVVPTGTYFYTIEVRHQNAVVQKKGFLEVIQ